MTADELLKETTYRIHEVDGRSPEEAMLAFVAAEVLEYDGLTVAPDQAYVDRWLSRAVAGRMDEDAAEIDADIVEALGRFLA